MYTKQKAKKTCRATPIAIESKLKPLPNIGNASKVACHGTCKNRNCAAVSKPCSRSNDRAGRSGSVTERDTRPVRMGKVLHSLNKKSRESIKYTACGRSSDPSFEDPARRSLLPDPYADLKSNLDGGLPLDPNAPWWLFLAEMKLQARRQAVNLDSKPESHQARQEERSDGMADSKQDSHKARKHDTKTETKSDEDNALGRNNSKSEVLPSFRTQTSLNVNGISTNLHHSAQSEVLPSFRTQTSLSVNGISTNLHHSAQTEVLPSFRTQTSLSVNGISTNLHHSAQTEVTTRATVILDDSRDLTENDESSASKSSEHKVKENSCEEDKGKEDTVGQDDNDNDEEEDEEEDEMGLPQAVRALQSKPVSLNAREVVKERHRAMMEEMARTVRSHNLMTQLKSQGFFNYDYSPHARTNMTNHNLRKGKKKGMERLLLLLACRTAKCTGELYGIV